MAYYLFDNPRVAIVLALAITSILFLGWALSNKKLAFYWVLVGPFLLGLALLLDALVQTDREQVVAKTRGIVRAAEQEDAVYIVDLMADDFALDNGMGREQTAAVIEHHLARPLISKNRVRELDVEEIDALRGQVVFSLTTLIDPDSAWAAFPMVKSSWRFIFVRTNAESDYELQKMELLTIGDGDYVDMNIWKKNLSPNIF